MSLSDIPHYDLTAWTFWLLLILVALTIFDVLLHLKALGNFNAYVKNLGEQLKAIMRRNKE